VVFGKAGGYAADLQLSALDGSNGFKVLGEPSSYNGYSVDAAGDVNGDGYGDVVIGAYPVDAAYLIFGKAGGFPATIDAAALDGSNGVKLKGTGSGDETGVSVAGLGDINGDGYADVAVGAHAADPHGVDVAGTTYVLFGRGTAFPAELALASLNGTDGFQLHGTATFERAGTHVSPAGDLNGDGYADIAIGTYTAGAAGSGYVFFGHAAPFMTDFDLATLDGATGVKFTGETAGDSAGRGLATTGDFTGDGFGDLAVGAFLADAAGTDSGKAYLIHGRAPRGPVTRTGGDADQYINGGAFIDALNGAGGNDRLEGRGAADALDGGTGRDMASYTHAPAAVTASLANAATNTGDAAGDSYLSIEGLEGSAFNDKLDGNGAANILKGLAGADVLKGGGGGDTLIGGRGRDTLTGGSDRDIFVFASAAESKAGSTRDVITDFKAGTARTTVDKIDLSAVDAKTGVAGNQAFKFIGSNAFSHVKGQLRLKKSGSSVIVQGDTDGNAKADLEIMLQGFKAVSTLTAKDFKL
jgi:Ca2+-binding RTX toxin-like protein